MKKEFPYDEIHVTSATIRYAFDKTDGCICTECGDPGSINLSGILTRIIQNVGRFAENWASDCLYTIDHIRSLCENTYSLEQEIDEIYCFGIRKNGVDHNAYIMNRLMENRHGYWKEYTSAEPYYRRVLAVRVHVFQKSNSSASHIECTLKDLTCSFNKINKADLDKEGKLIQDYSKGNPIPVEYHQPPVFRLYQTIRFNRSIEKDFDYISPGGYEVKMKDENGQERTIRFDFETYEGQVDDKDPCVLRCVQKHPDQDTFPDLNTVTEHMLKNITEVVEWFIYTENLNNQTNQLIPVEITQAGFELISDATGKDIPIVDIPLTVPVTPSCNI